jgi:predicted RNA-binding protein with PIN domain
VAPDGAVGLTGAVAWLVDGNNVVGAGADGWWHDPVAASARLVQAVAAWCREDADEEAVTIVFDGAPEAALSSLAGGNLRVDFATRRGRDAADDRIVELVDDMVATALPAAAITVVTSDRGLAARLPEAVVVEGAGRFRARVGLARTGQRRAR